MTEPADPNQVDQQRRTISAARSHASALLSVNEQIRTIITTHDRLGYNQDGVLLDESFTGTGTDKATYMAAIDALNTLAQVHPSVFVAIEKFAR